MLTDFYCEFKERKQVAAIYDSYPILVLNLGIAPQKSKDSFQQNLIGMNTNTLPIVKTSDQETGQNHDRFVALNVQHAQEFFEPDITAKAAKLRSGYEDKICDNALQLHILEGKMQKIEQQIKGEPRIPSASTG